MVILSSLLTKVRSNGQLEEARGLRLIGERFETRDSSRGREWNQIGRILHQTAAVEQIEMAIDKALGPGEGRKLLKKTGGVYGVFGARITKAQAEWALLQAETASNTHGRGEGTEIAQFLSQEPEWDGGEESERPLSRQEDCKEDDSSGELTLSNASSEGFELDGAEKERIRERALSGELIKFLLSLVETQRVGEEIRRRVAHPNQLDAHRYDSAFEVDAHRVSIILVEGDKVYDVLSEMEKAGLADEDPSIKREFAVEKLRDFLKQDGDTEEVLFEKLLHASTLLNQNIILSTALPIAIDKIGGLPVGVKGEGKTNFLLEKTRDRDGAVHFGIDIFHTKARLAAIIPQEQGDVTDLIADFSSFSLRQSIGVPADSLAMGDASALTVHCVEIAVQMTKAAP